MQCLKKLDACVRDPFQLVNFVHYEKPVAMGKLIHEELEAYRIGTRGQDLFEVKEEYISVMFDTLKEGLHENETVSEVTVSTFLLL